MNRTSLKWQPLLALTISINMFACGDRNKISNDSESTPPLKQQEETPNLYKQSDLPGRFQIMTDIEQKLLPVGRLYLKGFWPLQETVLCTGTLIGSRAVITARHCIENEKREIRYTRLGMRMDFFLDDGTNARVVSHRSSSRPLYPLGFLFDARFDIAVLELDHDIGNTKGFIPVRLSPVSTIDLNPIAIGYPATVNFDLKNNLTQPVRFASVNCGFELQGRENPIYKTACTALPGMSGGPLLQKLPGGGYELLGVASFYNPDNGTSLYPSPISNEFLPLLPN